MKAKKKPHGIKQKIHEQKEREKHILLRGISVAILAVIILILGIIVSPMLDQHSIVPSLEPKAAIVDQASLSPAGGFNETFIEKATNTLEQAGYTVDYYQGEKVTVEFYRYLPTHGYSLVILRAHSAAAAVEGEEFVECPVCFFTSELYSKTKYLYEQYTNQLVMASYTMPLPPYYFGISPYFVTSSMKARFQGTTIIMTGCEGLNNTKMADAFITKGAKVYIGWDKAIYFSHTDAATINLLQHLLAEKQTINHAVKDTMKEVGPDPAENSLLTFYPLEVGDETIENKS